MANDMGQGFWVGGANTAEIRAVGPTGFILVCWNNVQSCTVDESPIFETHVETREKPRGTVAKSIFDKGPSNLSLIREGHQLF
jgi:hypothetical protein